MATPLIRALRRTFPSSFLVFICSRPAFDAIRYNPHLDRVIPVKYRHLPAWLSPEKREIRRLLLSMDLDWALVLESHRTFIDLARGGVAGQIIAYGSGEGLPNFQQTLFDPERHCIVNHLDLARPLGVRAEGLEMEMHYPPALNEIVAQRLERAGISRADRVAGIHAGWGSRSHSLEQTRLRSWPLGRFADIARWLVEKLGVHVVLTGSKKDRPLTRAIARNARVRCVDLAGELPLLELAALIRRLNVYVTVDSGPAHLAAAVGAPLVTLWGPGIMAQTVPLAGRGPVRVLYHHVPCAPCYGTPLMKTCRDNICMKEIRVEEVQEAVLELLG